MELRIDEALRYLGAENADDALRAAMADLAGELQSRIIPRWVWRAFSLPDDAFPMPDSTLAHTMLADCRQVVVLACTLGAAFDQWVRREQARDVSRAVMLDALGSAWVEAACDAAESEIHARFPNLHLTDRFSPGYGDLPLSAQIALLDCLDAPRRLGITLTPSMLMLPQKSVTALLGLSERPQPARVRGCARCTLADSCPYRKAGTTCHV